MVKEHKFFENTNNKYDDTRYQVLNYLLVIRYAGYILQKILETEKNNKSLIGNNETGQQLWFIRVHVCSDYAKKLIDDLSETVRNIIGCEKVSEDIIADLNNESNLLSLDNNKFIEMLNSLSKEINDELNSNPSIKILNSFPNTEKVFRQLMFTMNNI